jgi:hypothetical protein
VSPSRAGRAATPPRNGRVSERWCRCSSSSPGYPSTPPWVAAAGGQRAAQAPGTGRGHAVCASPAVKLSLDTQPDLTQRDRSASRLGQDRSRSSHWHCPIRSRRRAAGRRGRSTPGFGHG